jgi:hypothetical protein
LFLRQNDRILHGAVDGAPEAITTTPFPEARFVINGRTSWFTQGDSGTTKEAKIPVGQARTVEGDLFSDLPTAPRQVSADGFNEVISGIAQDLPLSLDRTTGASSDEAMTSPVARLISVTFPAPGESSMPRDLLPDAERAQPSNDRPTPRDPQPSPWRAACWRGFGVEDQAREVAEAGRIGEPTVLYGDSSPFPYGYDFLESVRAVVECCVAMLSAQVTIDQIVKHGREVEARLNSERKGFEALLLEVQRATSRFAESPRLTEATTEVVAGVRGIVEREREHSDRQWTAEMAAAGRIVDEACATAYQALETLLLRHAPPQTSLSWRLVADDDGYDGTIELKTRFGVDTTFGIAIPETHALAKPVRVADVAPMLAGRMPRGRRDARTFNLDKLYVSEALLEPERVSLMLKTRPRTGNGWRFDVGSESGKTFAQPLGELGQPCGDIFELSEDEREPILRLSIAVLDSTFDLALRRQWMIDAKLDGESLSGRYEPRDVCGRLVTAFAPIVSEIVRRSGSPNELMLRRDLGAGRRESRFVTRAELRGKMACLPASVRTVLAPFGI